MTAAARIALVGAGNMGSNHARVVSQTPGAELTVLVDPREDHGRAVAERHGTRWAAALDEALDADGVIIAAATEAHYDLARAVISHGVPLLIEKPVADSLARSTELVDLAERRDVPLMCGLLERYNPAVLTARSFIEKPLHVTATRHSPYARRIRTGVAWDLLVHDVDLAIRVMGNDPTSVDARLGFFHPHSAPGAEDVAEAILGFPSGGMAHVSASRVGQRKIRQLSIYEEDRLVEIDLLRRDVTVYHHVSENSLDGEGRGYKQQTIIEIPEPVSSQEPLTAQFLRFLELVSGSADAAEERASILPSHAVIDQVIAGKTALAPA